MAIQDFTTGQVLTAAQMDSLQANDYNQTVSTKTANYTLVAADKGTRVVMNAAGATTITVNTSLFSAGDTLYLQNIGAGVTTVTAGTATVSSAGPLAIPQYGSGTLYFTSAGVAIYFPSAVTIPPASSGLVVVKAETAFNAVASFTADNVFTSSYTNYLIKILYSTDVALQMTYRVSGTATTTNYNRMQIRSNNTGAPAITSLSAQASLRVGEQSGGNKAFTEIFVYAPQIAQPTFYMSLNTHFQSDYTGGNIYNDNNYGNQSDNTQFDGVGFAAAAGSATGTYTIYGYSKTV
jgi:hypothetical protein